MLKIRRSHDPLIINMVIPIPWKDGLYIETGLRSSFTLIHFLHYGSWNIVDDFIGMSWLLSARGGKSVKFNEEVEVKTVEPIPEVVDIDEVSHRDGTVNWNP